VVNIPVDIPKINLPISIIIGYPMDHRILEMIIIKSPKIIVFNLPNFYN